MQASSSLLLDPYSFRPRKRRTYDPDVGEDDDTRGLAQRHPRVKPYVCETCSNAFDRPSLLTQHMLAHTGEKPHLCPRCDTTRFARTSNLYRHMRTCKGLLMSGAISARGDSPAPSRETAHRPASPTSQASLTEDPSVSPYASVTSETIPFDPSSAHAPIKSWRRQTYSLPNTNQVSLPVSQRFYVQDAALYKSIISAAGSRTALSTPSPNSSPYSSHNPGLSPSTSAYNTANSDYGQGWDIPGWVRMPSSHSWASTTPESYKLVRNSPPSKPSLPVAQSVYVQDAEIYKAVISAGMATPSPPSRSSPSPYSGLDPGAASQNNAYAAPISQPQAWYSVPWEYTLAGSSGFRQYPAQYRAPSDAGPTQLIAESSYNFWDVSAAQGWEIVAGPEHGSLSGPSETHHVSCAPSGAGETSPSPRETPSLVTVTRDVPLTLELPLLPVYPIPNPSCLSIVDYDPQIPFEFSDPFSSASSA